MVEQLSSLGEFKETAEKGEKMEALLKKPKTKTVREVFSEDLEKLKDLKTFRSELARTFKPEEAGKVEKEIVQLLCQGLEKVNVCLNHPLAEEEIKAALQVREELIWELRSYFFDGKKHEHLRPVLCALFNVPAALQDRLIVEEDMLKDYSHGDYWAWFRFSERSEDLLPLSFDSLDREMVLISNCKVPVYVLPTLLSHLVAEPQSLQEGRTLEYVLKDSERGGLVLVYKQDKGPKKEKWLLVPVNGEPTYVHEKDFNGGIQQVSVQGKSFLVA